MQASVIIPVWNGANVIVDCLEALFARTAASAVEVICVDNNSADASTAIIRERFPQVRLLPQPVNLGFAGGVNAGMRASQSDIFLLLNQDCLVHDGWLTAVADTFARHPQAGILGGTLYREDGSVDHAGAAMQKPSAYGQHHTAVPADGQAKPVDYVTGALFALRRTVWEQVGPLDEGFYPAYFEESDYCYRARHKGFDILYAPALAGTHLFSSREWQQEPTRHTINQHRSRYRFVIKHFSLEDLHPFFEAEKTAVTQDTYEDQVIGRLVAARAIGRDLPQIIACREQDLDATTSTAHARLLSVRFSELARHAWEKWRQMGDMAEALDENRQVIQSFQENLRSFRQQEYDLIARIYFRHPEDDQPETGRQRWWRLLVKRPLSIICLRDYFLQSKLNTLHVARLDEVAQMQQLLRQRQQLLEQQKDLRLRRLEMLREYEQG